MRTHDRRIDAQQPPHVLHLVIYLVVAGAIASLRRGEHALIGAILRPAAMPFPYRLPRPELSRQITPGHAGTESPADPLQDAPMLTPRTPPPPQTRRQQRLQNRPQLITDHTRTNHDTSMAAPTPTI